jgi:hypothetical protein
MPEWPFRVGRSVSTRVVLLGASAGRRMLGEMGHGFVAKLMLPSAAMGHPGFQATSHAKPSGSAKWPE